MLDLARLSAFQDHLIWVEGIEPETWPAWDRALRSYSDACRNDDDELARTLFVVPLCGTGFGDWPLSKVALTYRDFRDKVHFHDLFVFALQRGVRQSMPPEHRGLLAHAVAQLSQWDVRLAERLLDAGTTEILKPHRILLDYAEHRGWGGDTPERWEEGTADGPLHRPVVHSALLAVSGRDAKINRRLWAAQASVLMPLVEERRADFVYRHRSYFQLPFETDMGPIERYEDLEVGHVVYYFEQHQPPNMRAMREARRLRHFRNKLAHIEPLSPDQALHPILLG